MSLDMGALRNELIRDEGLQLKAYRCTAGSLTIGVGRNLDSVGIIAEETMSMKITKSGVLKYGITREQALKMLDYDIERFIAALDRRMPWWREMSPIRQRVVVNMTFNLGITGLLKFKNTLKAMREGRYEAAAQGMEKSLWYRQVGDRAKRLVSMMRAG